MKVSFNRATMEFNEVNSGEVFMYKGEPYMAIHNSENFDNAVHLVTGETYCLDGSQMVELCKDAQIVLNIS